MISGHQLQRVTSILNAADVQYALIGAVALASRGAPRSTYDLDLFTTEIRVLDRKMWDGLDRVDVRRGDQFDPLRGVVRIGAKPDQIDIVVGKWKWEQAVIERAEPIALLGVELRVPKRSDLILLKLAAGGVQDYADAYRLLALGPREQLIAEVNAEIASLPADAQKLWARLLSES